MLTDHDGILRVNRDFLGKAEPTDVISFLYGPLPGGAEACSGEVVVNVERALEVSGGGPRCARELALYIAHGLDHLSGASDRTRAQRARMRRRELGWLREAEKRGHLDHLVDAPRR